MKRLALTFVFLLLSGATFAATCSSDYDCNYGERCLKAQFEVEGYCAQKVNRYDIPVYTPPDPNSVKPGGEGQCRWDTDCPVLFHCAKEGGSLTGYCLSDKG